MTEEPSSIHELRRPFLFSDRRFLLPPRTFPHRSRIAQDVFISAACELLLYAEEITAIAITRAARLDRRARSESTRGRRAVQ
jgi:hypothetical protein